jgi:hypothetical protein
MTMVKTTNPTTLLVMSVLLVCIRCAIAAPRTITVDDDGPADFNSIQAAINDANSGDTVLVLAGYYSPYTNGESFPIVLGEGVILMGEAPASTVIDGNTTVVVIETANDCTISGFTVKGNGSGGEWNEVIWCKSSSVTISNNVVYENGPSYGVWCSYAENVAIEDNIFNVPHAVECTYSNQVVVERNRFNGTDKNGVSVDFHESSGSVISNVMDDAWHGISCYESDTNMVNNIIYDSMYGIDIGYGCSGSMISNNCIIGVERHGIITHSGLPIIDNIIANAQDKGIYCYTGVGSSNIAYNNMWDNNIDFYQCWDRHDNISVDPCFADPNGHDYHLKSEGGRWDPNSETWVLDDVTSPCIDAGDPNSLVGDEPLPNGGRINMGAYGGTDQASKSLTCWNTSACAGQPQGDATCDGNVNLADLFAFKANWLKSAPWSGNECCADFDHSGHVSLADLFILKAGFGSSGHSPSTDNQNCPP